MDYFEETDRARNRGLAAYSSASFGYSFSAMTVSIFLMYYYTDVLELSALSVTVILFVARFFDGAVDPFIGHYMDGHTTKYGKYRGYLLYWAGPSCVFFVILFVPSPLPGYGALLWYMSAYLLWSFSASMLEVSYLPLMASISCGGDRNLTNTLKISASIVAVVATSFLTLKLVKAFGGGSARTGFFVTMSIFACVTFAAVMTGAVNIREERVPDENGLPFHDVISVIFRNKRLVFLYLMIMGEQMGGVVKNQAAMYYLKYYLNRPDVIPIFLLAGISGALLAQPLVLKASRRARQSSLMIGGYLMAAASIALVWISDQSLWLLMTVNVMFGLFMAFPANLVYVYAADLADELSYAGNGSFSGIVNSLLGVAGKFGYAAAGSAVALMLHMTSYAPNVPQSPPAIWGIKMCFISLPAIIMILSAVFASASFRGGRAPDIHADVREDASAPYV